MPQGAGRFAISRLFAVAHIFVFMFSFSVSSSGGANNACCAVRAPADTQNAADVSKNSGGPRHAHFVLRPKCIQRIERYRCVRRAGIYFAASLCWCSPIIKSGLFSLGGRLYFHQIICYTSRTHYLEKWGRKGIKRESAFVLCVYIFISSSTQRTDPNPVMHTTSFYGDLITRNVAARQRGKGKAFVFEDFCERLKARWLVCAGPNAWLAKLYCARHHLEWKISRSSQSSE